VGDAVDRVEGTVYAALPGRSLDSTEEREHAVDIDHQQRFLPTRGVPPAFFMLYTGCDRYSAAVAFEQ
jgi:hypothetical protein